jgi:hypothetical protein
LLDKLESLPEPENKNEPLHKKERTAHVEKRNGDVALKMPPPKPKPEPKPEQIAPRLLEPKPANIPLQKSSDEQREATD